MQKAVFYITKYGLLHSICRVLNWVWKIVIWLPVIGGKL